MIGRYCERCGSDRCQRERCRHLEDQGAALRNRLRRLRRDVPQAIYVGMSPAGVEWCAYKPEDVEPMRQRLRRARIEAGRCHVCGRKILSTNTAGHQVPDGWEYLCGDDHEPHVALAMLDDIDEEAHGLQGRGPDAADFEDEVAPTADGVAYEELDREAEREARP